MCSVSFAEMRKSLNWAQEKYRTAQKYAERRAQNGAERAAERAERRRRTGPENAEAVLENRKSDFRNDII